MAGRSIAALSTHRQTRRQISRALGAGGINVLFIERSDQVRELLAQSPELLILDCDNSNADSVEVVLEILGGASNPLPVVLLSVGADKAPLLDLILRHDIGNLVAKHGAIRAVYPVLDERELLVTCEKVIRRNIFGIDKYVSSWGVVLHRATITAVADKVPFLTHFEQYLNQLDCPPSVIPSIVTVAEELILNAVVHAPRLPDGTPKYEERGLAPDLVLEPHEYVHVAYGCDGQRLMLSVTDHFGRLEKKTLHGYLSRGFYNEQLQAETKASGAGLGLSLALRSIHQLIFNIEDTVRTEVIAGWYLRVATASEFRLVGKSINLFWLPARSQPSATPLPPAPVIKGRIDENTDFGVVSQSGLLDLREVTAITSRGLLAWLRFVGAGRQIAVRGWPDPLVPLAVEVAGMLQGVSVESLQAPYECTACGYELSLERNLDQLFEPVDERCPECYSALTFSGAPEKYQTFLQQARGAGHTLTWG